MFGMIATSWKETMCENLVEHVTNLDEIMLSYFAACS